MMLLGHMTEAKVVGGRRTQLRDDLKTIIYWKRKDEIERKQKK